MAESVRVEGDGRKCVWSVMVESVRVECVV